MSDEILPANLKKGMLWNQPRTQRMLQFEKETGCNAIRGNKITGTYVHYIHGGHISKRGSGDGVKKETQMDWAIKMLKAYLKSKNKSAVGPNRLHYWIVTRPEDQRQIPIKGKEYKLYINIGKNKQKLTTLLAQARLRGLISPDLVIDEKNPKLIQGVIQRVKAQVEEYKIPLETGGLISVNAIKMLPWKIFNNIKVEAVIMKEKFNNQVWRIVVAIEKGTASTELESLCHKYGADFQVFGGQPSVTREWDEIKLAKKDNNNPIYILYINDLDPAGLFMAKAYLRNIETMYPHRFGHRLEMVCLTREQAKGLPASYKLDDKGLSEKTKQDFIDETGSDVCIELDALDEDVIVKLLERSLRKIAGRNFDIKNTKKFKVQVDKSIVEAKKVVITEANKIEYEELRKTQANIAKKVDGFKQGIKMELNKFWIDLRKYKNKLTDEIKKKLV